MSSSTSSSAGAAPLILISAVLLLSSIATTSAFNITRLLEQYPDFGEFNGLLSQTHLPAEINSRRTITVLALANGHLGEISGKPEDVQKRMLSTHIILDYFDILKLSKVRNKTIITTLYQASGIADDQQGFLKVIHKEGGIVFGSAMVGASFDSRLLGSVASRPYNISVLSISQPIIAPGIDGTVRPLMPPPPPSAPAPAEKVPPPAESPEEEVAADAPAAEADAPAPADASAADAPASGPSPDAQPADAADENNSQEPKSAAGKPLVSGVSVGLIVALASFLAAH